MGSPRLDNQHIIDELNVVCNSLGSIDQNDGTYMKDRDCKPCLREILRYLNADSGQHAARCHLGQLNIIKSDLIHLMVQYCDYHEGDPEMFTTILRLSTNLTSSALLLFENQEVPADPEKLKIYNKILTYLYGYKEAFAGDEKIWSTLNIHLGQNVEDDITFERLIILIRNILHIPVDSTGDMGVHNDSDAHEMCLYRMNKSGMLNTIIKIASETKRGTEYCFHMTEIIYLMLRDQNPKTLASSKPYTLKRKLDDSDPDKKRLQELSARDRRERLNQSNRLSALRFKGAAFTVVNRRSLSDAPPILSKLEQPIDLNKGKTEIRKSRNRKPLSSETSLLISDTNTKSSKISYNLMVFCRQFVEKVYNNYMQQIKHNLIQKKTQDNDESYYLWAIQYFTSFTRHLLLPISNISETLSTSTLHYIQILISSYQDKLKIEKKKYHDVSKRLHLAIRAYKEILDLIKSLDGTDSEFSLTIEKIQRNIFSETEYSTIVLNLFQQYEEQKHSKHYLKDLIMTNDSFTELLEKYSNAHPEAAPVDDDDEEDDNDDNNDREEENFPTYEKVGIDDLFDDPDLPQLNEETSKKEPKEDEAATSKPKKKSSKKKKSKKNDFKTAYFMSRYCHPDVIKSYLMLLREFKSNEDSLNLAILRFLERLVYDCKQEVILFQASVFKCLLDIMDYHSSLPGQERFMELGKHLMKNFGTMANKRRWMFQELLFWKTVNDCAEIETAIDPPPVIPIEELRRAEELEERLDAVNNDEAASRSPLLYSPMRPPSFADDDEDFVNKLPSDSVADLMAELNASDLSNDTD